MAKAQHPVEISIVGAATPEVVEAFARLLPQLSSSAIPLTHDALTEILASPQNTVFLARDPSAGGRIIGTLTLVIFRIPTAIRARRRRGTHPGGREAGQRPGRQDRRPHVPPIAQGRAPALREVRFSRPGHERLPLRAQA